jgi:hypothetical protein
MKTLEMIKNEVDVLTKSMVDKAKSIDFAKVSKQNREAFLKRLDIFEAETKQFKEKILNETITS